MGNKPVKDENVPQDKPVKVSQPDFKVVAAIDIGTANTGFAFALVNDETQIRTGTFRNMLEQDRVPTMLLLDPNKEFHSLDDEALEKFTNIESEKKQKNWFFFRLFKMELYKRDKLCVNTEITDHSGKTMAAVEVFTKILHHLISLANKAVKEEQRVGMRISEDDIQWVLTVPAIWSAKAREFMIKAALDAGAHASKVRLVLEPEAASMYCRRQLMIMTGVSSIEALPIGQRYILADLGGGTADICSHEILPEGKLRELYRASGGEFGGNTVNMEFENYMLKIVGASAWIEFKQQHPLCYFCTMKSFESEKKRFKKGKLPRSLTVEKALVTLAEKYNEELFEVSAGGPESSRGTTYDKDTGRLQMSEKLMTYFFKKSVDGITSLLQEVIEKTKSVETLLLVGGYAESQYLRSELEQQLGPSIQIRLEQQPMLAVMKGAVEMGFKPMNIVDRVVRYTYGFPKTQVFQAGKHPLESRVDRNGQRYCDDVFDVLVRAGSIVKCGDKFSLVSIEYLGSELQDQPVAFILYRSNKTEPKYCLEDGCEELAQITINPPPTAWPVRVKFTRTLEVMDTRLRVKVVDNQSNQEYETEADFLEE